MSDDNDLITHFKAIYTYINILRVYISISAIELANFFVPCEKSADTKNHKQTFMHCYECCYHEARPICNDRKVTCVLIGLAH